MKIRNILIPILILLLVVVFVHPSDSATPNFTNLGNPNANLSITFLNDKYQSIGGGCYNAQINVTIVYTGAFIQQIPMTNFILYFNSTNLIIENVTNYQTPANKISFLTIFPGTTFILTLDFVNFCVPANAQNLKVFLFYYSGTFFNGTNQINVRII